MILTASYYHKIILIATTAMSQVVSAAFLTTSDWSSCVIKMDGTVRCWGFDEDDPHVTSPPFFHISSRLLHTCGLRSDYSVSCWGKNNYGQATPPPYEFIDVSAGAHYTCGIKKSDKTIVCWGLGVAYGGVDFDQTSPPVGQFVQISTGRCEHACAIMDDGDGDESGEVKCWGNNWEPWDDKDWVGQAEPPTGIDFKQISVGCVHSCGLKEDGTVECWGSNDLGDGLPIGQSSPPSDLFKQISAGFAHNCGIKMSNNTVKCWGWNSKGQATPPSGQFREVSAGVDHTCGIKMDDTIDCWGNNEWNKSTPPSEIEAISVVPPPVNPSNLEWGRPYAQFFLYPSTTSQFAPPNNNIPFGITLSAHESIDFDGHLVDYEWSYEPEEGVIVPYIYNAYGNATTTLIFNDIYGVESKSYDITLTVTDNDGNFSSATTTVELDPFPDPSLTSTSQFDEQTSIVIEETPTTQFNKEEFCVDCVGREKLLQR